MAVNQLNRQRKRSRASDVADKTSQPADDQSKRRRVSDANAATKSLVVAPSGDLQKASKSASTKTDVEEPQNQISWSFSSAVGGRYNSSDPVMTSDEAYLFIGLDSAVQVVATSTHRVVRSLQVKAGQRVIGFKLCPINEEVIYIFTSTHVTKWNWDSGKQLSRRRTDDTLIAVDVPWVEEESQLLSYSINARRGKRQIIVYPLENQGDGTTVLETKEQINKIQVINGGKAIIASDGSRLFLGSTSTVDLDNLQSLSYTWREAIIPVVATCFHLQVATTQTGVGKTSGSIDLVLGETNGSILIYHDIFNTLFGRNADKKASPRKLHWHRGSVNVVRWSKDGNYIISGGNEPVLVIWQLDTGRKHTVPHLSSPIFNVLVSPQGTSYIVQFADNSTSIFSTRELGSAVSIVGLQVRVESSKDLVSKYSNEAALLHPQHPEQLLVVVPASHQPNQQSSNCAVLQTYDIRANCHISRQALARTNTTTLSVGPEGSPIVAPNVRNMDILENGKWLATVDVWSPNAQDVEALVDKVSGRASATLPMEVYLKFWKWDPSASTWQLVTRIDGPHFKNESHRPVLGLVARPCRQEFVTIGADAFLRFWCPAVSHRASLKKDSESRHDTWKQRSSLDLSAYLRSTSAPLKDACVSFSEDGSVLAVCFPSESTANAGLILLINVRDCSVHYQRTGVFSGTPSSIKFLGRHLIVASTGSVVVWDTVDDFVKPVRLSKSSGSKATPLLATNPRNQTFAIASSEFDDANTAHSSKRAGFNIQIYSIASLSLVFQGPLGSPPLALLSDVYSGDYIVLDLSASVQRLSCSDKASQKSIQPLDVTAQLNTGLASIFSRGQEREPTQAIEASGSSSQSKALSNVFGDAPSFSLPSLGVLFRNVVDTLQNN